MKENDYYCLLSGVEEHNTLNDFNESLEHGGMEASSQEVANSLQQSTIQIQDCTETEITNSDLFEAIESCYTNVPSISSLSRDSVSKRPKKKTNFWSAQLYKDLEEKKKAYNDLQKDMETNHKHCKQTIESLQNEVCSKNFIIGQLNAKIKESCEKSKLNDKKNISHLGGVKDFDRFTKFWIGFSMNLEKTTNVLQKKWYKKFKVEVDHYISNKRSSKKNDLTKLPLLPKHLGEEEITSVLSPPYSDNSQSTCHSNIDIEDKSHSLTENMKSMGKKVDIFQRDNMKSGTSKDKAAVRDYESYTEDIPEELRQDVLISSLLSPIKNSDEDVDNIPKEEITLSVLSPPYSDNGQSTCHSGIDIEDKGHSLTENMKSEGDSPLSSRVRVPKEECQNKVHKKYEDKNYDIVIKKLDIIIQNLSDMKSGTCKDKAAVRDYESYTEDIPEELRQDVLISSLLSPIKNSDEDVDHIPSNVCLKEYEAFAPSSTLLGKKKQIARSISSDEKKEVTTIETVPRTQHMEEPSTQHMEEPSTPGYTMFSPQKTKLGYECLKEYEAFAPSSVLLGKKKRIARSISSDEKKEVTTNETVPRTQHMEELSTQHMEEPSTPGNTMFSPQKTKLGNECLKEYEAFAPSSVLLGKKKRIARSKSSDEKREVTTNETVPRTQHMEELSTQHMEEPSTPGYTMFSPQKTKLGYECLKEYEAFAPSSVLLGKKKRIARSISSDEKKEVTTIETVPRTQHMEELSTQHMEEPSTPGNTMFSPQKTKLVYECLKEYEAFTPSSVLLGKKKRIARSISSDEKKEVTTNETVPRTQHMEELSTQHMEEPSTPGNTMFSPQKTKLVYECLKEYEAFAPSSVLLGKKKRIARSISSDEKKEVTTNETVPRTQHMEELSTQHMEEPSTPGYTMFSPQKTKLGYECLKEYEAFAPSSVLLGKKKRIARSINSDEKKEVPTIETVPRTQHMEELSTQHMEEPSTPGNTMFSPQKTKLGYECLKEYEAFAPSSVLLGKKKRIARSISSDEKKEVTTNETVPRTQHMEELSTQHMEEPSTPGYTMFSPQKTKLGNECLKEYEAFAPSSVLLGKKKRIARSTSSDEKKEVTTNETVPRTQHMEEVSTQHMEEPSTPGYTMFSPQKTKLGYECLKEYEAFAPSSVLLGKKKRIARSISSDEKKEVTTNETVPTTQHMEEPSTQHMEEPSTPGNTMISPQKTKLGNECLKEYEAFVPSSVLLGKKKRIARSISSDEKKEVTTNETVPTTQHMEEPSTQHMEEPSTPGNTMISPQKTKLGNECLKEYEAFVPSSVLLGKKKRIARSISSDEKKVVTTNETVPTTQHMEEPSTQHMEEPSTPGNTMISPQKTKLGNECLKEYEAFVPSSALLGKKKRIARSISSDEETTIDETVPRTQHMEEPSTPGNTMFSPQKTKLGNECLKEYEAFAPSSVLLGKKKLIARCIISDEETTIDETVPRTQHMEEPSTPGNTMFSPQKTKLDIYNTTHQPFKRETSLLAVRKILSEVPCFSVRKVITCSAKTGKIQNELYVFDCSNDTCSLQTKEDIKGVTEYEAPPPSTSLLGKKKRICKRKITDAETLEESKIPATDEKKGNWALVKQSKLDTESLAIEKKEKDNSSLKESKLDTGLLNRCKSKIPTGGMNGINDSALKNLKSEVEGVKDSVADIVHKVSIGIFDVEIEVEGVKDSVADIVHKVSIGIFDVEIDYLAKKPREVVKSTFSDELKVKKLMEKNKFDNKNNKVNPVIEKKDFAPDEKNNKVNPVIEKMDFTPDNKNNKVNPVIEKKDFTPDEKNNKINPVIEKKDFTPKYFQSSNGHFSPFNHSIIKGVRTRGGTRQRRGSIRVLQKSFSKELYPCEDKERSTSINWFGKVLNTESVNENTMMEKTVKNIKGKRKSKSDRIKDLFGSFSSDDETSRNDKGQNEQQGSVNYLSFITEDLALSSSSEDSGEPFITKPIINGERNLLSKLSSSGTGQYQQQTSVNKSSPHLSPQRPSYKDLSLSSSSDDSEEPFVTKPIINGERNLLSKLSSSGKGQNQQQASVNDSSPHLAPRRPSYKDLSLSSSSGQNQKQTSVNDSSPHLALRTPSYEDFALSSSSDDSGEPFITKPIINGECNLLSKLSSSGTGQNQQQASVNDSSPHLAPRRPSYKDLSLSSSSGQNQKQTSVNDSSPHLALRTPSYEDFALSSSSGQNQKQTSVNDSSPHLAPQRLSYEDFTLSTSSDDSEEPFVTKPIINGERNLLSKLSSSGKGQNQQQATVNDSSPHLAPRRPSSKDLSLSSSSGQNQKQTSVNDSSPHLAPRRLSYEDFTLSTSSDDSEEPFVTKPIINGERNLLSKLSSSGKEKDKQLTLPVINEDIHLEETSTGKGITTMCKKEGNTHFQLNNSMKLLKSKMDIRKIFKELTVKTTPIEQETCDQLSDASSSPNFRRSSRLLNKTPVSYDLIKRKKRVNENVKNKQNSLKDNILVSSEISDSDDSDSNKLVIIEDSSIYNDSYDLSSHLFEDLNEPKSTEKTENQPSTSSGFESKFIPSFYKEREEITEESVLCQSLTKPHELEVEDIIQMEKSCNLTLIETLYVHSNILEESFKIDGKTMVENEKWTKLRQNLRKERRICDQVYRTIFQEETQPLLSNVQLLKKCSLAAQVKSLLDIFPTEDDISSKPIFNPKNKHKATILQKKQYAFIRFINIYLIEYNGRHPFLKCIADEVVYYIRNFRGEKLKVSKCMQVTELLAVLCNQYNLFDIAQAFIYDCLYWLKILAFPLIYSMAKIYPKVLPHSEKHIHLLDKVFVHCILNTPSTSNHISHIYLQSLKHVVWNYYNYPKDSENSLALLKILLRKITEPGSIEAILLMCKRQDHEWVYKNVVKYLIDFFIDHKMKNEDYAVASMRLIGMVVKPFPQVYSEDDVNNLISILKYLLFDPKGSILVKEEIALALCHLTRFNPKECATILLQWQPSHNLISKNTMQTITNILTRQLNGSEWAHFVLQSTKERTEISYESLSEVEDVELM